MAEMEEAVAAAARESPPSVIKPLPQVAMLNGSIGVRTWWPEIYERSLGGGHKVITFVIWTLEHADSHKH